MHRYKGQVIFRFSQIGWVKVRLTEAINACFYLRKNLLRKGLRKNREV